ncbi:MAG: hypothetical protein EOP50_03550 [Sphingobacteriales bacterium]|nr:MAG: hypothetical protein EOP50_03550 [Sphingobacteriales bacterium]
MTDNTLRIRYRDSAGTESLREYERWTEAGHYLKVYPGDGRVLTFRKDRVLEYIGGCERLVKVPLGVAPPTLRRAARPGSDDTALQILFTGFAKADRVRLEKQAGDAGLQVTQTVTKFLTFLCAGPNAGPAKVERSMKLNAFIFDEHQFAQFTQTGELPG